MAASAAHLHAHPDRSMTLRLRLLLPFLALLLGGAAGCCCGIPTDAAKAEEVTLFVAPYTRECTGMVVMQCMLVKERPQDEWGNFYGEIEGFAYEPGYSYRLRVLRRPVANPPADGSSVSWHLLEVLERTRA
ncbi:MAG TPA: DUF4377 domain-containing protein [Longimicrobiaceae bacterium]|nr:DUF4377 domain-containing protein [Longimicrobiaceae bacterium]